MPAAKQALPGPESDAETDANDVLRTIKAAVAQIGDELKKVGAVVVDSAPVQSAVRAYEAEAKLLHETTAADVAAKSFELLTEAKDNVIKAAKAANNTAIVVDMESKVNELHRIALEAVTRLQKQSQMELDEVKKNTNVGWIPDKMFLFMVFVAMVAIAVVATEFGQALFKQAPPRGHGGYSTPGTNKAEDSLYEILNEIKISSDTAFQKAIAEVQAFKGKQTGQVDEHIKVAHEAAIRAIKKLHKTLVLAETKTATSMRDLMTQAAAKMRDKLNG